MCEKLNKQRIERLYIPESTTEKLKNNKIDTIEKICGKSQNDLIRIN